MLTQRLDKEVKLLKRHIKIFKIACEKGPIGMGKISEETGIPKHKVRYSLRILEKEDLIEPSNEGARAKNSNKFFNEFKSNVEEQIKNLEVIKNLM